MIDIISTLYDKKKPKGLLLDHRTVVEEGDTIRKKHEQIITDKTTTKTKAPNTKC